MLFYRLLEAPGGWCHVAFHLILDAIWQVAEEVDTRQALQVIDTDNIGCQVLLVFVERTMFHIESDGFVAAVDSTLVLAEDGHKEVLGHSKSRAGDLDEVRSVVYGASAGDVECVAEICRVPAAYFHFQVGPDATIEAIKLRLHIAVEEGLAIGLEGVPAVGTGTHVTSGIARSAIVIIGGSVFERDVSVFDEVVLPLDVASTVGVVPPEGTPSLRFLGDIPFDAEIDFACAELLYKKHIHDSTFEFGYFQARRIRAVGYQIGIGISRQAILFIVVRRTTPKTQRHHRREQEK